jgi:hypothetical protein
MLRVGPDSAGLGIAKWFLKIRSGRRWWLGSAAPSPMIVIGSKLRNSPAWRRGSELSEAAELAAQAVLVHAVLGQHRGVLGVIGVDLVGQLAAGLAGLIVLALAAQQLQDLILVNIDGVLLEVSPGGKRRTAAPATSCLCGRPSPLSVAG